MQVWLALHLIWTLFAIINMTQGQRLCSFYATLLPFTTTGIALLITDVIYAILFLIDAEYTYTESKIFKYFPLLFCTLKYVCLLGLSVNITEIKHLQTTTSDRYVQRSFTETNRLLNEVVEFT